jgi:hypothetical protein
MWVEVVGPRSLRAPGEGAEVGDGQQHTEIVEPVGVAIETRGQIDGEDVPGAIRVQAGIEDGGIGGVEDHHGAGLVEAPGPHRRRHAERRAVAAVEQIRVRRPRGAAVIVREDQAITAQAGEHGAGLTGHERRDAPRPAIVALEPDEQL